MIGVSGTLIRSETLMELIFIRCGEFRRSPEGPVTKSTLHTSTFVSALLRPVQMLKREWGCGEQREATAPIQALVKLQPGS